jgi:hypothetical protein
MGLDTLGPLLDGEESVKYMCSRGGIELIYELLNRCSGTEQIICY